MWRVAVVLAAFVALSPGSSRAGYAEGVLAYDRGDFPAALSEFQALAQRGHPGAEFMLGAMYFYGKGVLRNDALAAIWFHKAALQGSAQAQLALGSLHIRGLGVRQDLMAAYTWLTIAARHAIPGLQQQATALRQDAAAHMEPEEIARAEEAAASWRPRLSGLPGG